MDPSEIRAFRNIWICLLILLCYLFKAQTHQWDLNSDHVKFFFGDEHHDNEVLVHLSSRSREKRSAKIVENPSHLELTMENGKGKINFFLQMNRKLISANYNRVVRGEDGTIEENLTGRPTKECFYVGSVKHRPDMQIAVSNCDGHGFTGIVVEKDATHLIKPANRTSKSKRTKRQTDDFTPDGIHIIHTRPRGQKCAVFDVQAMTAPKVIVELTDDMLTENLGNDHIIRKRQIIDHYEIETAVFVDDAMYSHIGETTNSFDIVDVIEDIVFTIMNGVALLYDATSLKLDIDVTVIHLDVMKRPLKKLNKAGGEILGYLNNFCVWQASQNYDYSANKLNPKYLWDHAILITGMELYDRIPEEADVIGLAWVSGMCRRLYSCTINQGTTFEAVYVITHEMGHNLGMSHDGDSPSNQCARNAHIMSASTGPGKVTWSVCSNRELSHFLQSHSEAVTCLSTRNLIQKRLHGDSYDKLPGEKFNANDQCEFAYGPDFEQYVTSRAPYESICRELWCHNGSHAMLNHPALEGTSCNQGKGMCTSGVCLGKVASDRDRSAVPENKIPHLDPQDNDIFPQRNIPTNQDSKGFTQLFNKIRNLFRKYLYLTDDNLAINLPQWTLTNLSRCSAQCGGGWQVGELVCRTSRGPTNIEDCAASLKPSTKTTCNTKPCLT